MPFISLTMEVIFSCVPCAMPMLNRALLHYLLHVVSRTMAAFCDIHKQDVFIIASFVVNIVYQQCGDVDFILSLFFKTH